MMITPPETNAQPALIRDCSFDLILDRSFDAREGVRSGVVAFTSSVISLDGSFWERPLSKRWQH